MIKRFEIYKELPKSMYVLFFVQIINRFGDFVVPFLTLYLTTKLGLSVENVGIIVGIASFSSVPGTLLGGKFADKIGKKKVYILAQTMSAFALIPCAYINKANIIIILIIISTFFNGVVRPIINAIITDILPSEKRKIGFSLQYLGINLGVSIGPIVAGFLFNNYLPMLFLGDALTSLIAVLLVTIHIKETKPTLINEKDFPREKNETGNIFEVLLKKPEIIAFLLIYILYSIVYAQNKFALPLTLNELYINTGSKMYGFLMSVNAITVIFFSLLIMNITKKLHTLINITIAGVLYAIGFGMVGIINSYFLFIISTVVWTIGEILMATNMGVYLSDNSPANFRARFSALGSLGMYSGSILGTLVSGKLISLVGINVTWGITFVLAIISASLMFGLYYYSKHKNIQKYL